MAWDIDDDKRQEIFDRVNEAAKPILDDYPEHSGKRIVTILHSSRHERVDQLNEVIEPILKEYPEVKYDWIDGYETKDPESEEPEDEKWYTTLGSAIKSGLKQLITFNFWSRTVEYGVYFCGLALIVLLLYSELDDLTTWSTTANFTVSIMAALLINAFACLRKTKDKD